MRRLKWFFLKFLSKYKFRNNDLAKTTSVNIRARLTSVKASDYVRFAEFADVRNTEVNSYSTIGRYAKITNTKIGKFCAISWDCTINAISHPHNHLTIHAFPYVPHAGGFVKNRVQETKEVVIGNDVWVGANSVIMPGVEVGDGAIIGASAVVTKNVPPYAVVAGVPAKIIRYRFSNDVIQKLQRIKWWDLDRKTIIENIALFQKPLTLESLSQLESRNGN